MSAILPTIAVIEQTHSWGDCSKITAPDGFRHCHCALQVAAIRAGEPRTCRHCGIVEEQAPEAPAMNLNPSTITRRLRAATGARDLTSRKAADGVVIVSIPFSLGRGPVPTARLQRDVVNAALQLGYDAAARTDGGVVITLPEPVEEQAPEAPATVTTEHGTVHPASREAGFIATPQHSCGGCPSVGATLCTPLGESIIFPTVEAARQALAEHTVWGCREELPECPVCLDDGQPCDSADHPGATPEELFVEGERVRHCSGQTGTVVVATHHDKGDLWVTVAFDGDGTERHHPARFERITLDDAHAEALAEKEAHDDAMGVALPLEDYLRTVVPPRRLPRAMRYGAALRVTVPQ